MRKKYKGSAILWAVCSLLVISFIITGLLAINKSYSEEEIRNISQRQAEYYARSAVDMTVGLVEKGKLHSTNIDVSYKDFSGYDDAGFFIDKLVEGLKVTVNYDFDGNTAEVELIRSGTVEMQIRSTAVSGYAEKTVIGIMKYKGEEWRFEGYVTY